MKRSPLIRKQGLTRKACLSKISPKQELELAKRRLLKWELYQSQKGYCAVCGRWLRWNQCELSHKDHIGMGGCKDNSATTKEDCEVVCNSYMSDCHPKDHKLKTFHNEQPDWSSQCK